ncbi:TPA: hypothetical protein DCE37_21620 [Candidatus Latescibacteria bacterium]|nr:hypothetical protein [Candidatus Latescibacterota bacterium]
MHRKVAGGYLPAASADWSDFEFTAGEALMAGGYLDIQFRWDLEKREGYTFQFTPGQHACSITRVQGDDWQKLSTGQPGARARHRIRRHGRR